MVDKVVYDLPDGFFEAFVPKALAVDVAALAGGRRGRRSTRRGMALVVVGDRAKVEAPLAGPGPRHACAPSPSTT